jgi:hypothetical protein
MAQFLNYNMLIYFVCQLNTLAPLHTKSKLVKHGESPMGRKGWIARGSAQCLGGVAMAAWLRGCSRCGSDFGETEAW